MPILGGRTKRNLRQAAVAPNVDTISDSSEDDATPSSDDVAPGTNEIDSIQTHETANPEAPTEDTQRGRSRSWLLGFAVFGLLLLTVVNVGWTYRDHWLQQPTVHQWLLNTGWVEAEQPEGMLKSPAEIQLVSRDMHSHPTRTGILVLSVTFVNLAQQTQAFPVLRITLLDGGNQPIAQRHLQPAEYLRAGANTDAGLAPDVFLPVLLELADPGKQAVGFEIEFL